MAAVTGRAARVLVTAAAATSSTDNAATLSTSGLVLQIDSTARRHWDRTSSTHIKIFEGATNRTTDIAAINYVQGNVTLDQARSTASSWTVDVEYLTASYLGLTNAWSLDVEVDQQDVTSFSTSGTDTQWRTYVTNLHMAEAELGRFVSTGTTGIAFMDRITAEQDLVVELWADSASNLRFEGFANIAGDSFSWPLDGVGEETVTLQIDGPLYRSTA